MMIDDSLLYNNEIYQEFVLNYLKYHDKDASHCKHCGNVIYQETDGNP